MDREKYIKQLAQTDLLGIKSQFDHLGMTRPSGAHLLVARLGDISIAIAALNRHHAAYPQVHSLKAPETTACQNDRCWGLAQGMDSSEMMDWPTRDEWKANKVCQSAP